MISYLQNKAEVYRDLMRHPGWELLKREFPAVIEGEINNTESKEAFLYQAIRAKTIADIFNTPAQVSRQAQLEMERMSQANVQAQPPQEGGAAANDN